MRWAFVLLVLQGCTGLRAQVIDTGSLRATMWNGQQAGIIAMDVLTVPGMYGLGPLEYLRGEITLLDGRPIVSHMADDTTVVVEQRADARAPFFVHQYVKEWVALELPANVVDLPVPDAFLAERCADRSEPFFFRLRGSVKEGTAHVMDLPPGTVLEGPSIAHATQKSFTVRDTEVELIGVFSTKHRTVFTHHDSNVHVHLVTSDGTLMGHVDKLLMDPAQLRMDVAAEQVGAGDST
jgi:acetolactate decarboxylase